MIGHISITSRSGNPDRRTVDWVKAMAASGGGMSWNIAHAPYSICRGRNLGVAEMYLREADWLLTVDDGVWDYPTSRVLDLLRAGSGLVRTAVTPTIQLGRSEPHYNFAFISDERGQPLWERELSSGTFPVRWCGTACILIHSGVFDAIGFPWFEMEESYEDNVYVAKTEDIVLCNKLHQLGIGIQCHSELLLQHTKDVNINTLINKQKTKVE